MRNIKKIIAKSFLVISLGSIITMNISAIDNDKSKLESTNRYCKKTDAFQKNLKYAKETMGLSDEEADIYATCILNNNSKEKALMYVDSFNQAKSNIKDFIIKTSMYSSYNQPNIYSLGYNTYNIYSVECDNLDQKLDISPYCLDKRYPKLFLEAIDRLHDADLAKNYAYIIIEGRGKECAEEYIKIYQQKIKEGFSRVFANEYTIMSLFESKTEKDLEEFVKIYKEKTKGKTIDTETDRKNIFYSKYISWGFEKSEAEKYSEISVKAEKEIDEIFSLNLYMQKIIEGKQAEADLIKQIYKEKVNVLKWNKLKATKYIDLIIRGNNEEYALKYADEFENQLKLTNNIIKAEVLAECITKGEDLEKANKYINILIEIGKEIHNIEMTYIYADLVMNGKEDIAKEYLKIYKRKITEGLTDQKALNYINSLKITEITETKKDKYEEIYSKILESNNKSYADQYIKLYKKLEAEITDKQKLDICIKQMISGKDKEYSIQYANLYSIAELKYKTPEKINIYINKIIEGKNTIYIEKLLKLYDKYFDGDALKAEISAEYEIENGTSELLKEYIEAYFSKTVKKRKYNKSQAKMYSELVISNKSKTYINKYMNAYTQNKFSDEIELRMYSQKIAEGENEKHAKTYTIAFSKKLKETNDPNISEIYAYHLTNSNIDVANKKTELYTNKLKEYKSIEQTKTYMKLIQEGKSDKYADSYSKAYIEGIAKYKNEDETKLYAELTAEGNKDADKYIEKYSSYKTILNNNEEAKQYTRMILDSEDKKLAEESINKYLTNFPESHNKEEAKIHIRLASNKFNDEYIKKYIEIYRINKSKFDSIEKLDIYINQIILGNNDKFAKAYANSYINNINKSKNPTIANAYAYYIATYGEAVTNKIFPIYKKKLEEFKNEKRARIYIEIKINSNKTDEYATIYSKAYIEGETKFSNTEEIKVYADKIASDSISSKNQPKSTSKEKDINIEKTQFISRFNLTKASEEKIETYFKIYKEDLKGSNSKKNTDQIINLLIINNISREDFLKHSTDIIEGKKKWKSNCVFEMYFEKLFEYQDTDKANTYANKFSEVLKSETNIKYAKIYTEKFLNFSKQYADKYIKTYKLEEKKCSKDILNAYCHYNSLNNKTFNFNTFIKAYDKKFKETKDKLIAGKFAYNICKSNIPEEYINIYDQKEKEGWDIEKILMYVSAFKLYKNEKKSTTFANTYEKYIKMTNDKNAVIDCSKKMVEVEEQGQKEVFDKALEEGLIKYKSPFKALIYGIQKITDEINAEAYTEIYCKLLEITCKSSKTNIGKFEIKSSDFNQLLYLSYGKTVSENQYDELLNLYTECIINGIENINKYLNLYLTGLAKSNDPNKAEGFAIAMYETNDLSYAIKFANEYYKSFMATKDKTYSKNYVRWFLSNEKKEDADRFAKLYKENYSKSRNIFEAYIYAYYSIKNPELTEIYINTFKTESKSNPNGSEIINYIKKLDECCSKEIAKKYSKLYTSGMNKWGNELKAEVFASYMLENSNIKLAEKYTNYYTSKLYETKEPYKAYIYADRMILTEDESDANKYIKIYEGRLKISGDKLDAYRYTSKIMEQYTEEEADLFSNAYTKAFSIWGNQYKCNIYCQAIMNQMDHDSAVKYTENFMFFKKKLLFPWISTKLSSDKHAEIFASLKILEKNNEFSNLYVTIYYNKFERFHDDEKTKFYTQLALSSIPVAEIEAIMIKYEELLKTMTNKKEAMIYSLVETMLTGVSKSDIESLVKKLYNNYFINKNPLDKNELLSLYNVANYLKLS